MCLALAGTAAAQVIDSPGPSVLSRGGGGGVSPSAPITFRPYINITGVYTNGLAGALVNSGGNAYGGDAAVGVYGYHSWKHTVVGLNYRGDYRRYSTATVYDGTNQLLNLGITHQPSKHVSLTFREAAGTFTQNSGYMGTFGFFDSTFAQIPQNEILDTRVYYLSTMADATYMRSARLSFNFGGTGFLVRRRVSSLYGVTGSSARCDTAYRLTRFTTVGVDYFFTHFGFNKAFGGADMHSVGVDYSIAIAKRWTLSLRAGVIRAEAQYLGTTNIDPLVAAIIGQTRGVKALHTLNSTGTYQAQLSRVFRHASTSVSFSHGATPGNGIYLTSSQDTVAGHYSYSGLRRWSISANGYYASMRNLGQDMGRFEALTIGAGVARSIGARNVFFTARIDEQRAKIKAVYGRNYYNISVGFAYSPGDIPLRLW